jgi:hypothetical protein
MSDVTQFSSMFARMAVDYARSPVSKRGRPPGSGKSALNVQPRRPTEAHNSISQDERAIRTAMEAALARRAQARRVA